MFCSNCGVQLAGGVNFCPNCGAKVIAGVVTPTASVPQGNMLMLVSTGNCSRATAAALLQQLCGYAADEALLILDSAPITVARGLTDAQARYLAQAFAEYGLEVSVYDGTGWREWESESTSVWDKTGALLTGVASALGLMTLNNRITRDMIRRMDYPYRFSGGRPPVYRLNTALRAAPRRIEPIHRPVVHHAPPPPPRPAPAPVRPAPPRPAPAPARPAPVPRPAAPAQHGAPPMRPNQSIPQGGPANRPGGRNGGGRPGGGTPGGRPGGGAGRRG